MKYLILNKDSNPIKFLHKLQKLLITPNIFCGKRAQDLKNT